jgi:hypothetical protein
MDNPRAKALPLPVTDPVRVAEAALERPEDEPAPLTREQRRSRRRRAVRASTISIKRMTKRDLELGRLLYPYPEDVERPRVREDCRNATGARPCPFVSCKHHLYLDVSAKTGAIKLNFPDLEVWEMTESCALDGADQGGMTLEAVAAAMNLTRERVRQIEVVALAKAQAVADLFALRDYAGEGGPAGKRRLPVLQVTREELDEPGEDLDDEGAFGAEGNDEPEPGDFDIDDFVSLEE